MVDLPEDACSRDRYSTCRTCHRVVSWGNSERAKLKHKKSRNAMSKKCSNVVSCDPFFTVPDLRIVGIILLMTTVHVSSGFNLDIPSHVEFDGPKDSYFGYTVAMLNKGEPDKWLLFGAPKANSTFLPNSHNPGEIYKCTILPNGVGHTCLPIEVDRNEGADNAMFNGVNRIFDHGRNDQWLGASLDVNGNKGVVTCASRWYNTLFLKDDYLFMNGLCYELPLDFKAENIIKIPALINGRKQTMTVGTGNATKLNYGMGSLGSSAHYTSQGTDLLLGAPGLRTWTGGFVDVRGSDSYLTQYNRPATEISEMAGYAITSGDYFGNGHTYFAIGAPRDKLTGKVYVYRSDQTTFIFENADITLDGSEKNGQTTIPVNGFFGAALSSVDVNKDGCEDLLVGSPFYNMASSKQEEGIVLVYLGQKDSSFKIMPKTLTGSGASGARFGSSIASLGDINKDTYNDVVIGAPYEDEMQGAIYVYNGCKTGVWQHYSQRIAASELRRGLQSFGISFSRPQDMNEDGVNDMAVGAYLSDKAYLLYGQSVINVQISIEASVAQISTTGTMCVTPDGKSENPCYRVNVCFSYNHAQYLIIDVKVKITLDLYMGEYYRTAWASTGNQILNTDLRIFKGEKTCIGEKNVLIKSTADLVTPVLMRAEYTVDNFPDASYVKPTINRFDGENPNSQLMVASLMLDFKKDCPNNECKTDLHLSANAVYDQTNGFFVIGTPSLSIDIEISKTGHPSYSSTLFVAYPKVLQFQKVQKVFGDSEINCGFVESEADNANTDGEDASADTLSYQQSQQIPEVTEDENMLICSFGNPLYNDTGVSFKLIMHVPESVTETNLEFRLNATTLSTETKPIDNVKSVNVVVRNKVTTIFKGISRPSYITINKPDETHIASHVLELRNKGPSLLPSVKLTIQYPQVQAGGKPLLYLNATRWSCAAPCTVKCTFPASDYNSPVVHFGEDEPTYFTMNSPNTAETSELTDMTHTDCTKGGCSIYECRLHNIPPRESAVVSLDLVVSGTILGQISEGEAVKIKSDAYVKLEERHRLITDAKTHFTDVLTDILPQSPPPQTVPWWVILISIIGGILLIVILVLILWKIGFFKRQKKAELEKMQQTGEVEKMLSADECPVKE